MKANYKDKILKLEQEKKAEDLDNEEFKEASL